MNACSEERIRNGAKKLMKARQGSTQGRLDNFFKVTSVTSTKRKVQLQNIVEIVHLITLENSFLLKIIIAHVLTQNLTEG